MPDRHPTASHWQLPPADRPPPGPGVRRTNLRELEARPDRFEHHLMVLGRIGVAQIEVAVASEPLYFAHRNISDEYVVPMTSGDPMADAMPMRTFISDFDTDEIVARYKHGADQLLLHPYSYLHWPGKLRPPYAPFEFGPGMRRTAFSLVFCSYAPAPPGERPLFTSRGLEADTKRYSGDVPMLLADLRREPSRPLGAVGDTTVELLVEPDRVAPPNGGYAVVLTGADAYFPGDLVYIPPGASAPGAGIDRALLFSAPRAPEPPPPSWDAAPPPPFAVYEDGSPGELPISVGDMTVEATGDASAAVRIGDAAPVEVPRYWLARMLFRLALHEYALGYLETYGGFFYDDTDGQHRLGVRGVGAVTLSRADMAEAVETLYRATAPEGYVERLA